MLSGRGMSKRRWLVAAFALATTGAACGDAPVSETTKSTAEAVVVCARGATVEGIDVSYYQGNVNWAQVKASGREFAIARVADGTTFMDPKFASYYGDIK